MQKLRSLFNNQKATLAFYIILIGEEINQIIKIDIISKEAGAYCVNSSRSRFCFLVGLPTLLKRLPV